MTVDELIQKLQELKLEHGACDVALLSPFGDPFEIEEVKWDPELPAIAIKADDHYGADND